MILDNKVSWTLLFIGCNLLAVVSFATFRFGSSASPAFSFSITTEYQGADPEEIERLITIPVEDGIGDIPGIRTIRSTSEFSRSRVIVVADGKADMDSLYADLSERIDRVRSSFPRAVQKTRILSSDDSNTPVFIVAFSPDGMGLNELGEYVADRVKPGYQGIQGAGEVETGGRGNREVLVRIDAEKAALCGIDPVAVSTALQGSCVRMPLGSLTESTRSLPLFFDSGIREIDDFADIGIPASGGRPVLLSDIASLSREYRESDQIARLDGRECVILYVYSAGDANPVSLCAKLLEATKAHEAAGLDVQIVYDRGAEIMSGIRDILASMAVGMASLILFIGLFIPDLASKALLSASVPLSLFLGFSALSAFRVPVNSDIISGLTIGSGLIIDNYLIMYDFAARNGNGSLRPIAVPLLAGTLTTVIVFFPLMAPGSAESGLKSISFSICAMLVISLFLSFTFLPAPLRCLAARGRSGRALLPLEAMAKPFMRIASLAHSRKRAFAMAYLAVILAAPILLFLSRRDFSRQDSGGILFARAEFPSGTTVGEVDRGIIPYLAGFRACKGVTRVESNSRRASAHVSVAFDPKLTTLESLQASLESIASDSPAGRFFFGMDQDTGNYKIALTLTGYGHETLRDRALEIGSAFASKPWVSGVIYHFKENPPAYVYTPNPSLLRSSGIPAGRAASILRWNLQAPVALKWITDGREHDVRVGNLDRKPSLSGIGSFPVPLAESGISRLDSLGSFEGKNEPDRLYRENRQSSVSFTIMTGRIGLRKVNRNIAEAIASIPLPSGFGIFADSSIEDALRGYRDNFLAFGLSIFLIYALLAVQNESFAIPLLILTSIPFSAFFPLAFLAVFGQPVTAAAVVGIIILAGTSVNSFIMIVDELKCSGWDGRSFGGIEAALRLRFNPLFLSCGTSVLAALPMLFSSRLFTDFPCTLALIIALGILGSFLASFMFLPAVAGLFLQPDAPR